jgi:hypothetical protein
MGKPAQRRGMGGEWVERSRAEGSIAGGSLTGFAHVHAQARQLLGDGELLRCVQRRPGALLSVSERRVENDELLLGCLSGHHRSSHQGRIGGSLRTRACGAMPKYAHHGSSSLLPSRRGGQPLCRTRGSGCRSHRRRAAAIRHASNADLFTAPRLGGLNVLIDHLTPRCYASRHHVHYDHRHAGCCRCQIVYRGQHCPGPSPVHRLGPPRHAAPTSDVVCDVPGFPVSPPQSRPSGTRP